MADEQPPKKRSRFSKIFVKAKEATSRRLSGRADVESGTETDEVANDATNQDATHQFNQVSNNQRTTGHNHGAFETVLSPTQTTAALANLTVQDKRRQGIYGLEALGVSANDRSSYPLSSSSSNMPPVNPRPLPYNSNHEASQDEHTNTRHHTTSIAAEQTRAGTHNPRRGLHNDPIRAPGNFQDTQNMDVTPVPTSSRPESSTNTQKVPIPTQLGHFSALPERRTVASEFRVNDGGSVQDGVANLPSSLQPHMSNKANLGTVAGCGGIDIDRDQHGNLLPLQNQPQMHSNTFRSRATTPNLRQRPDENLYSSPERLKIASELTRINLKRKRTLDVLPPPAFVYVRSNDPSFNVFNGFKLYPELCFLLAKQMQLKDLISLYAIDRDFHTIIDTRFTTVCLDQAMSKAPDSAKTFHFRSYKQFCRVDPVARIVHPDPKKALENIARTIPSFRWVRMVIYREKLIHEVMAVFAERGVPLPVRCALAIKRMWYIMDMPSNSLRIGAVHNHTIITDLDLYFAMAFFVKLDMLCNSPVAVEKRDGLRKLMLSMPDGFTTVHRVLTRQRWQHKTDVAIAWVRHTLTVPELVENPNTTPEELGVTTIFKVPVREVGLLKYEYWGRRGTHRPFNPISRELLRWQILLRPDQLVMREAVRRGLRFHKHILRSVLYGYIRPDNLENYLPRNWPRRIPEYNDEEYGINDSVGGLRALSFEEGGDPLLDLGDSRKGSKWTHVQEAPAELALKIRESEEAFMKCIEWWAGVEEKKQDSDDLPGFEDCMTGLSTE